MSRPRVALATCAELPHPDDDAAALAAALHSLGVEVVHWGWEDAAADWASLDACVIRSTWNYHHHLDAFLAWAGRVAAATRLFNPLDVVRWNAHKGYLIELAERGVPVVPTTVVASGEGQRAIDVVLADGWAQGEVVVKPAVSAGARDTVRLCGDDPRLPELVHRLRRRGDVLVQPFLPEIATGEVSLVYVGDTFSHAVRKVPTAGDFRVQPQHGGDERPCAVTGELVGFGAEVLAAAGFDALYARVDLVELGGGPVLMELEVLEPALYLALDPAGLAASRLATAIRERLG